MTYLEKIHPSYFDLLLPLSKWKILDIKSLREESGHSGTASAFYKIIAKLEANALIDSFINSWSNQKYIYLLPTGMIALGLSNKSLLLNRETRFHDSMVAKVARSMASLPFCQSIYLDFEIRNNFPLLARIPDFLIEGELASPFKMAVEVELTPKSKERLTDIFQSYSQSKVVNNVLYVTDKLSIIRSYQKYLMELGDRGSPDKFLFLHTPKLSSKDLALHQLPLYHLGKVTSFEQVFLMKKKK